MMSDLRLNDVVIFSVDYRSPPSGCGTIERRDGSLVLIQEEGCHPEVLDGIYEEILHIEHDFGEEHEKANEELLSILKSEGVEYVYDWELADQRGFDSSYIEFDKFVELRRSYC
tara:strand:- start:16 stop:357 length:342 start_codon:yes stop_codon:yes gene_type:complete